MVFIPSARRYRPQRWAEVLGQPATVRILQNTVRLDRVASAYIFEGQKGCGKTSIARLLAKTINCASVPAQIQSGAMPEPCDACASCRGIAESRDSEVLELDAASHRGIDDARELQRIAQQQPRAGAWRIVILDECFAAGTMVGAKRIEDVRVGDLVPSWNEGTRQVELRRVLKVLAHAPSTLVRVTFSSGCTLVCTSGQPLLSSAGWRLAGLLHFGETVLSIKDVHAHLPLCDLWHACDQERESCVLATSDADCLLLKRASLGLRCDASEVSKEASGDYAVRVLRCSCYSGTRKRSECCTQAWAPVVFGRPQGQVGCGSAASNHAATVGRVLASDEDAQPYVGSVSERKNDGFSTCRCLEASLAGWQRVKSSDSASDACNSARLAYRAGYSDRQEGSGALQTRHSERELEGVCGSGREFAQGSCAQGSGSASRQVLAWARVDRVEVLERGSDGRFAELRAAGLVYNFEVEGNHTYLANGLVAHNCHMLTKEAQSALLALFESPPSCFLPILCTTDSEKILPTIASRCSKFLIRPLPQAALVHSLRRIFADAQQPVAESVLHALARTGDGSLRDVQQIADQLVLCANGDMIDDAFAEKFSGVPTISLFRSVAGALTSAWLAGPAPWFEEMVALHDDGADMRAVFFQVVPTLLRDLRVSIVSHGLAEPVVPYDSGISHALFEEHNCFSHADLDALFQSWDAQARYFGALSERANLEFFFSQAWDQQRGAHSATAENQMPRA